MLTLLLYFHWISKYLILLREIRSYLLWMCCRRLMLAEIHGLLLCALPLVCSVDVYLAQLLITIHQQSIVFLDLDFLNIWCIVQVAFMPLGSSETANNMNWLMLILHSVNFSRLFVARRLLFIYLDAYFWCATKCAIKGTGSLWQLCVTWN